MSDRKEFEDWFFSPSNSMSMSDIDVAWEAWQVSAQRPEKVPMTDDEIDAVQQSWIRHQYDLGSQKGPRGFARAIEAHHGIKPKE